MRLFTVTNLPLLLALGVLWLLGCAVSLSAPITGGKIVTALLFVLTLVWFVGAVLGLAR